MTIRKTMAIAAVPVGILVIWATTLPGSLESASVRAAKLAQVSQDQEAILGHYRARCDDRGGLFTMDDQLFLFRRPDGKSRSANPWGYLYSVSIKQLSSDTWLVSVRSSGPHWLARDLVRSEVMRVGTATQPATTGPVSRPNPD